jgi:hypothetical protein
MSAGFASAAPAPAIPLEITPVCAQASGNFTVWKVNNKNTGSETIDWVALDNGHTGSYVAPTGLSKFASFYDPSDPNNTTRFNDLDQTNSSNTPCTDDDLNGVNTGNGAATGSTGSTGGTGASTGSGSSVVTGGGSGAGNLGAPDPTPTVAPALAKPTVAVAAKSTAPQLAYTGASQVVPFMAAAILAAFTAVTTVLVRKNVI